MIIFERSKKIIVIAVMLVFANTFLAGYTPYKTYTYDNTRSIATFSPDAYLPEFVIRGENLGTNNFASPSDMFSKDNYLFIADSGNNRIVILDGDFKIHKIIDGFDNKEKRELFRNPSGVFVTQDNDIYIADTDNRRIVELDFDGNLNRIIPAPSIHLLPADFVYSPLNVAVDKAGRIYVVARSVNMGLIQLNSGGEFEGFLGAARVAYNPLDFLWRRFMTKEQIDRTRSFVPTEYNNIEIDDRGFIYVTNSAIENSEIINLINQRPLEPRIAPLKKLNPNGEDILKRNPNIAIAGDISFDFKLQSRSGPSVITDVALGKSETYTILDNNRNRYFTYSSSGELLFVFGLFGNQKGNTTRPSAITYHGDKFVSLDRANGSITFYKPTIYAEKIYKALDFYNNFQYANANEVWEEILLINANSDLAYNNIAKSRYMAKNYEGAMDYFYLSRDAQNYSKAFREYRNDIIRKFAIPGFILFIALIVLVFKLLAKAKKINKSEDYKYLRYNLKGRLVYAFYLIFHPFDGFYDLKHENRGDIKAAHIIVVSASIALIIRQAFKAFIFFPQSYGSSFSYINEISQIVLPVVLWVTANWCLTTLMDGEGSFKDIYISTAYALTPIIVLTIPATIMSHFLIMEEGIYVQILITLAYIWTFLLIFIGNIVTGQYTLGKGTITAGLSIVGIGVILFIALIFAVTVSQIFGFFRNVATEIMYRL